jgi:short subunit fatty acids transporter
MQKCLSQMNPQNIILIILGAWSLLLTVVAIIMFNFFRRLIKTSKDLDLKKILEKMMAANKKNSVEIEQIKKEIDKLNDQGKYHVQKIGLVRFNPFREIGGDHSFSLSILDSKNTGIVITGLHTRERTRVYVKAVKNGKSDVELSEEEKKAITKAQ